MCPTQHSQVLSHLNAGGACHFQDLDVYDVVSSVDVEDGAEALLMEMVKEANVAMICDPGLRNMVGTTTQ